MKKWILGACLLLLLSLISIYFFIPGKIVVAKSIIAKANQAGVYRLLTEESNWQKWWPSSSVHKNPETAFEAGGYRFKKTKTLFNSFEIAIAKEQCVTTSFLHILSSGHDTVNISWYTTLNTGINPLSRIQRYFKSRELGENLDVILVALKKYISNVQHVYGIDIKEEKVKIEFMVSTKKTFSHYPTTEDIYAMIGQIKKHIAQSEAKEEDYPMLHITASDSTFFETQVAIPVNKQVPDAGIFSSKRMLKRGNIIMAEIIGGRKTLDVAKTLVDQYISDHQYSIVAIPFESLVTDRMKETDTSKWVTRIYHPIR